jgi:hypothetical protein
MKSAVDRLAQRRQTLVFRSAALRQAVTTDLRLIAPAFTVADRAQDAWIWLRAKPLALLLPAVAAGLVWAVRKPSRVLTLPLRAWSLWRLWRRIELRLR